MLKSVMSVEELNESRRNELEKQNAYLKECLKQIDSSKYKKNFEVTSFPASCDLNITREICELQNQEIYKRDCAFYEDKYMGATIPLCLHSGDYCFNTCIDCVNYMSKTDAIKILKEHQRNT